MSDEQALEFLQRDLDRVAAALREDLRICFEGIHDRLDALNGRVRTHGEAIAVLQTRHSSSDELINRHFVKSDDTFTELHEDISSIKQFCALQHSIRPGDGSGSSDPLTILTGKSSMRFLVGIGIGSGLTVLVIWQAISWIRQIL